jgi:Trk K+ transport system NAD-binding subunit
LNQILSNTVDSQTIVSSMSFQNNQKDRVQYESSRTSEVGENDLWELDGPNDVKICLVVDKGDVQPPNEKKIFWSNFVFFCVKFFFYILLNFS